MSFNDLSQSYNDLYQSIRDVVGKNPQLSIDDNNNGIIMPGFSINYIVMTGIFIATFTLLIMTEPNFIMYIDEKNKRKIGYTSAFIYTLILTILFYGIYVFKF